LENLDAFNQFGNAFHACDAYFPPIPLCHSWMLIALPGRCPKVLSAWRLKCTQKEQKKQEDIQQLDKIHFSWPITLHPALQESSDSLEDNRPELEYLEKCRNYMLNNQLAALLLLEPTEMAMEGIHVGLDGKSCGSTVVEKDISKSSLFACHAAWQALQLLSARQEASRLITKHGPQQPSKFSQDSSIETIQELTESIQDNPPFIGDISVEKISSKFSGDYLATGKDIMLVDEPCIMCCMALLHSRIHRVFILKRNSLFGGFTNLGIHQKRDLNHRFSVFFYQGDP
jgi:hypothetical protein